MHFSSSSYNNVVADTAQSHAEIRNTNLKAALALAEAGVPVFPAEIYEESNTWKKKPSISEWQEKATTDSDTIEAWWKQFSDAVPAIAIGRAGLVVLDPDRHGDVDGVANFDRFIEGENLPACPITMTAGGGRHYIFRQPDAEKLGNGRGALPDGIDVRGHGGFIIAPGAVRPDGAAYQAADGAPTLIEAFSKKEIPVIPEFFVKAIRAKKPETVPKVAEPMSAVSAAERQFAHHALKSGVDQLSNAQRGNRNGTLNGVVLRLARMVASGWIEAEIVIDAILKAAEGCGLIEDDGKESVQKTFESAWKAGIKQPRPRLADGVRREAKPDQASGLTIKWAGSKNWRKAEWLVKDMIPKASIGMFVGESQAGKSFVSMCLAGSVACGKRFFDKAVNETGGTVYICAEGAFTIEERIQTEFVGAIKPHMPAQTQREIRLSDLPIAVIDNPPDLLRQDGLEKLIGAILQAAEEMKERHGVELKLVIIDTMIAAMSLDDWNSAAQAQKAMEILKAIQRATGAVVVGVHHHGKDKSRGATGSFAFTASADFILSVHRSANDDGKVTRRWIAMTKSRAGETGTTCDFDLTPVAVGMNDDGDESYCPYVNPQPDRVAVESSSVNQKKGERTFNTAFMAAIEDESVEQGFAGGRFKSVSKEAVRARFFDLYGESKEANRKAFERALKQAHTASKCFTQLKDGKEWLCIPDAVPVERMGKLPI